MGIWITRPELDADQLREMVEALGLKAVVSPLLEVEFTVPSVELFTGARAIIATSRNGLRGLCGWLDGPVLDGAVLDGAGGQLNAGHAVVGDVDYKKLPLYVVGEGSAELARAFGFTDIRVGDGHAQSLVPLITAGGFDQSDKLLHIRGNKIAFDLKGALELEGMSLCEAQTYVIVEAVSLGSEVEDLLQRKELDVVILMSPRTANVYGKLMKATHNEATMEGMMHLCFSKQVHEALLPFGVKRVCVMEQTELSHIIDCLKTLYLT